MVKRVRLCRVRDLRSPPRPRINLENWNFFYILLELLENRIVVFFSFLIYSSLFYLNWNVVRYNAKI